MVHDLIFSSREIQEQEGLTFSKTAPVEQFIVPEDEPDAARENARGAAGRENTISRGAKLSELVADFCISGTCTVNAQFSVGGERILLEAGITGEWVASCSRCLGDHKIKFSNSFDETYPLNQETIDIREDVRQMIILSFPSRSICKPDCAGLCSMCGKDLNKGECSCRKVAK